MDDDADLLGGLEAVPFDEIREYCLCQVDIEEVAARLGGTVDRSDVVWWRSCRPRAPCTLHPAQEQQAPEASS